MIIIPGVSYKLIDQVLRWLGKFDRDGWRQNPNCDWIMIHRNGEWRWPDYGEGSGCNESA